MFHLTSLPDALTTPGAVATALYGDSGLTYIMMLQGGVCAYSLLLLGLIAYQDYGKRFSSTTRKNEKAADPLSEVEPAQPRRPLGRRMIQTIAAAYKRRRHRKKSNLRD
jgi:hypothetical protein